MECCANLEDEIVRAAANAKRRGVGLTEEEMADHELLQYASRGDAHGLARALKRGAMVEVRRPLAMRPRDDIKGTQLAGLEDKECEQMGMTPLMFAAQSGSVDCVRLLVEAGAHINAVDEDLWTPLHFASKEGHFRVCRRLLEWRADPHMTNCDDRTPLRLAEKEVEDHRQDRGFLHEFEKAIVDQQSPTAL